MSDESKTAIRYHGEILRRGEDFASVDVMDFGVRLTLEANGMTVSLILSEDETRELSRHLRNAL